MIGCLGLAARLYILAISGNLPVGPLSGIGDQVRYQTLADSVFRGDGLTYARQPTALRAPAYPIMLAGTRSLFGSHYFLAVRVLQFLASILLAYLCLQLAKRLFGEEAGLLAGALALALPTLVFVGSELQTEALASLLTGLFLAAALDLFENRKRNPVLLGIYSGLSALLRFNAALMAVLAALGLVWLDRSLKRAALLSAVVGVVVLPWLVRNQVVFRGHVLYSTHGGINLLEGVLTPQGRGQAEEGGLFRNAVGWQHADIETNSTSRLKFDSEDVLDRQARGAALTAWKALDWKSRIRLLSGKVVWFWLSTDQLLSTSSFSKRQRYLRVAGVIANWIVLVLAFIGWKKLWAGKRMHALVVAFYCVTVTAAHLPFVMNTRLRIPFFDPLLAVLAAGAIAASFGNWKRKTESALSEPSLEKFRTAPAFKSGGWSRGCINWLQRPTVNRILIRGGIR